jgi:protein ImuB
MYACVYAPGGGSESRAPRPEPRAISALTVVAQQFSPRYESLGDLIVIDVRGLDRLLGDTRTIGEELRRDAADRGLRVHVAIAGTQTAARVLALARPGVVVVEPGGEAEALAPIAIDVLSRIGEHTDDDQRRDRREPRAPSPEPREISAFKRWGLKTLGDLAALPAVDLSARLGRHGLRWQALARGDDLRPLVPDLPEERFDASLDLEWPIEGLEPLSFVLTRLLEPLSIRLERRDRGVAVLHVQLGLVTKDVHTRRLELPSPLRDVRALRTLALLDLESHPPPGEKLAIDRVTVTIDPTPGRVLQHTLFTRPHPAPEQLSTLLARLGAAMGQDRIGAPSVVDSYRPGVFAMKPFATEHPPSLSRDTGELRRGRLSLPPDLQPLASEPRPPASPVLPAPPAFPALPAPAFAALRRCRQPVPARVVVDTAGRPARVTSDRCGFAGGSVRQAVGPWKTSGDWWLLRKAGEAGRAGGAGRRAHGGWDRDEWDVALSDGASYRVFLDHATDAWFIEAVID